MWALLNLRINAWPLVPAGYDNHGPWTRIKLNHTLYFRPSQLNSDLKRRFNFLAGWFIVTIKLKQLLWRCKIYMSSAGKKYAWFDGAKSLTKALWDFKLDPVLNIFTTLHRSLDSCAFICRWYTPLVVLIVKCNKVEVWGSWQQWTAL